MWFFNVHCHLLNFKYVPNSMVKIMTQHPWIGSEESFDGGFAYKHAELFKNSYPRLPGYIKAFRSKSLEEVYDDYKSLWNAEFNNNYAICPLSMDFSESTPDATDDNLPFYLRLKSITSQIEELSELTRKRENAYRIFPFVMFDPRRKNAYEACINCLEKKGFIGVKMYPALGYYPDPQLEISKNHKESGFASRYETAEQLSLLYLYCEKNKIPITVHTSTGGAYSTTHKLKDSYKYTEVNNWYGVLSDFKLKINFAHFGGNYLSTDREIRELCTEWRDRIKWYMDRNNHPEFSTIYADVAYHDMAHDQSASKQYFPDLNKVLSEENSRNKILFGTDAYMISHHWTESGYMLPFIANVNNGYHNDFFWNNAVDFLFDNGIIPQSYVDFIGNIPANQRPAWISDDNGKLIVKKIYN